MLNPQASGRPGLKAGRSNEFTLILPLKPGGAERLRKKMGLSKIAVNMIEAKFKRFINRESP